ncbi:hypothetical protein [Geodermatophilus ruber]|uniref:hypothetical protein n=1 Tax=Geodermatophilus ruber TaxID=504800 RepID=UPI0015A53241|nr:hypothetical protein [Geodermatophilus ruber]
MTWTTVDGSAGGVVRHRPLESTSADRLNRGVADAEDIGNENIEHEDAPIEEVPGP